MEEIKLCELVSESGGNRTINVLSKIDERKNMKDTLMKLKEVHSSSVLIILYGSSLRVYDEDANIVEYVSHIISKENVIVLKFKYLNKLMRRLRDHHISYVVLDSSNNYSLYEYYYTELNNYSRYLKKSKNYNFIRKVFIKIYNAIFGITINN